MHLRLTVLGLRPGRLRQTLAALEARVSGTDLLGCWGSVLGAAPRVYLLTRAPAQADHEALERQAATWWGCAGLEDLVESVASDVYSTLPCLPDVRTGSYGKVYEIRSYELHSSAALEAACQGWSEVIGTRLALAPVTTAMHSVGGLTPRLVHIYPYSSLAHRDQVRRDAIATGLWPPRGGAQRNRIMRCELAVPATFSPLC